MQKKPTFSLQDGTSFSSDRRYDAGEKESTVIKGRKFNPKAFYGPKQGYLLLLMKSVSICTRKT